MQNARYNADMPTVTDSKQAGAVEVVLARRLSEAERLFRDFEELTPYRFAPFVRSFDSFAEYERWKRAQSNPWYR